MNNIASVCTYIFCKGDDGKFYTLVGKRTSTSPSGANRYTPPMGMVEDGENPYNAAVRECMEETGVRLPKHKIVYYDEETYPMQGKQYTGANFYAFLDGTISNYPIGEGDGENEKFIWIPLSKIKTIPWAFGTGNKIKEIMNKLKIDMKKNTIRLTESELKRVITESVKRVLRESLYNANDGYTSSRSYDIQKGNTQQSQVPQFKHVRELDQANRKAIVDLIKRVCTRKDGYFDADEYRLEQAFEKEYGMSSDEMEEKGIWDIVRNLIEIHLEDGTLY